MMRKRYLFKFYYIGSSKFFGSQRQMSETTIESCLIKALQDKNYIHDLKNSNFEVASRTDKFVSARGAVFSSVLEKEPILMEINSALPKDIGLWAYSIVPKDFLSRFNAKYRYYKYIFPLPLENQNKLKELKYDLIKAACTQLEGTHDFKNFSKRDKQDIKTIRELISAKVNISKKYIIFEFKSKSFLRQQIRRMVAKILELGEGKISYTEFLNLFNSKNYISYQPANPEGLILWDIDYGNNIKFEIDQKSVERMSEVFSKLEQKYNLKRLLFKILQHNYIS